MYVKKIDTAENIFGDNIGYADLWDFSKSNTNLESRIEAITTVASVCYNNNKIIGSDVLYNRLKAESLGLPSSSFEFIPILFDYAKHSRYIDALERMDNSNSFKFGYVFVDNGVKYLLTNYRAVLYDKNILCESNDLYEGIVDVFNTNEAEQELIYNNHITFLSKIDIVTRSQFIRHRVSWQELSRRYVSGSNTEFEFLLTENLKGYEDFFDRAIEIYDELIEKGVRAEEARRVLPITMYTKVWSAFYRPQYENYIDLRMDKHAQIDIQKLATAHKKLSDRK